MNASKLLVKRRRLNANAYLDFLPQSRKAMIEKELKITHKDKKEDGRQEKEPFEIWGIV